MPGKRVCVITGANSGIGKRAAVALAYQGEHVVMVCRDATGGQAALDEVQWASHSTNVELAVGDLASQASVRALAKDLNDRYGRVDVLINNAGTFGFALRGRTLTEDGVETILATNHLGPFLLTNLLVETLRASAPARVVNVAARGLMWPSSSPSIDLDNLNGERGFNPTQAFDQSKLAQVMFTYELARRLHGTGVTANAVRVGNVRLDRGRLDRAPLAVRVALELKQRFAVPPEKLAETYVWLATAPELEDVSGGYFDEHNSVVKSPRSTYEPEACARLWKLSEEMTGLSLAL